MMRFGENISGQKYIDIYKFWGLAGGNMVHLTFFLLFRKTEKIQEHDLH